MPSSARASAISTFARKRGWARENPCEGVEPPAVPDSTEIRFLTLDEVDGVGRYAELEVVAPEERAEAAKAAVLSAAAEFGLTQSERRSYLQLLLEKQGKS